MTKKMWQYMPREKQKTVMLVYEPMTEEEIQELEEWYEEMWLAMEHDWIQEWKERGRMRPFTAEGIESRHDMPTYATRHADGATGSPQGSRAQWLKWAIGIGIAIMGAAALAMML